LFGGFFLGESNPMGYQLITAPASEPLTTADAKAHLRVDFVDDDALIGLLITAARQYCEQIIARSLISQQWRYVIDGFPGAWGGLAIGLFNAGNAILLEKGPVISLDSITYLDMGSATQTMPAADYATDFSGPLGRITPKFGKIWPIALPQIAAVQVTFTAGYGVDATFVPVGIKQWLKLRIGALYENREEVVSGRSITVTPMPFMDSLLAPYVIYRA
jgi:uncharacterized phiE125 gp8 family phage protein